MQDEMTDSVPHGARPHWRRYLVRVIRWGLVFLISLTTALVALEIGFRMMPDTIPMGACQSSTTLGQAYCQSNYRYDKPLRLGYVFEPGYGYDGPWNPADPTVVDAEDETCGDLPDDTFHYSFQADKMGFINHDTAWQDHYDMIVTGDSFSMPFAPVWWVDVLGEQTGMSVLNLGMNGWGTLAEVEAVRMYGLDKKPRWVVLQYFEGNDLFNVEEYHRRRESGMDWRTYQLHQVDPIDRLVMPHVLRYWWDEFKGLFEPDEEHVCRYPMTVATYTEANPRFQTIFYYPHIAQLSLQRDEILASEGWALVTQAILDLRAEVEAQGARFLLVYVPSKERLYFRHLGWDEEKQVEIDYFLGLTTPLRSYEEFNTHVDDQMYLMEEFARDNDLDFLNLSKPFYDRTMYDGELLYNFADVHWNEAGNRLTGQLIADYIQAASDTAEGGS